MLSMASVSTVIRAHCCPRCSERAMMSHISASTASPTAITVTACPSAMRSRTAGGTWIRFSSMIRPWPYRSSTIPAAPSSTSSPATYWHSATRCTEAGAVTRR